MLPYVVKFTVSVTNTSSVDASNVTVSASKVDLYTFDSIPAGQTRTFVRDVQVEMAGNFRFDARVTNQLQETETFSSDLIRVIYSTPTAAPTAVPIATPIVPVLEPKPMDDGLPPYVTTVQNAMGIAQWVFMGIGALAVLLIVVGAMGRVKNAAKSAKAPDHLDRNGYRDYTQAVPAKKRHMMPTAEDEDIDEEYHNVKPVEPAPVEEAAPVVEEADPTAVSDAMAQLYPEATETAEAPAEEATYSRRRKTEE